MRCRRPSCRSCSRFENEAEKVEEVKLEKSKCEQSLKELNKVLAPTKVWAKGKGLEV